MCLFSSTACTNLKWLAFMVFEKFKYQQWQVCKIWFWDNGHFVFVHVCPPKITPFGKNLAINVILIVSRYTHVSISLTWYFLMYTMYSKMQNEMDTGFPIGTSKR